ncbi:MAG: hypothetical protein WCP11_00120 [Candidatus Saccharibacteria bacterium]
MKITTKITVLCISLAVISSSIVALGVAAQATPGQISQIRNECVSLRNTLSQLHVSDALLRVNMGQRYELISTKLMDRFNGRLASNNFKLDDLQSSSANYKSTLDLFREDYKIYEENMVLIVKIDCKSQPSEFYDALLAARSSRAQVYEDIVKLGQQIDEYNNALTKFESNYQSIGVKN